MTLLKAETCYPRHKFDVSQMKTLKLGAKQIETLLYVAVDTAILQHGLETYTVWQAWQYAEKWQRCVASVYIELASKILLRFSFNPYKYLFYTTLN